ncbi:MAG: dipeptidyl-peptidase, partial [Thermoanaerobaculia bacterium]|nr:dipeptidyl-peptidase [Thermoanaerobaculia bacterium]
MKRLLIVLAGAVAACQTSTMTTTTSSPAAAATPVTAGPDVAQRMAQLPRTVIDYDRSLLDDNERQVVAKLIEASKQIDEIYWRQVSEGNPAWREVLARKGAPAYDYFIANKGPWDRLKDDEPFVGAIKKPAGAAFYPSDMTKEEFERYVAAHPAQKDELEGLFTV